MRNIVSNNVEINLFAKCYVANAKNAIFWKPTYDINSFSTCMDLNRGEETYHIYHKCYVIFSLLITMLP